MNRERIAEIKQMQHDFFITVKNMGCFHEKNTYKVEQLVYYFGRLQDVVKELVQMLENMSRDQKKFIVNLDDQLMGWIPIWVEKPKEFMIVNLFFEDDEIGWGYRDDENIFYSAKESIRYRRKVIAWRETNPEEQRIPDLELFQPPKPPKNQLFELKFVPFSSFRPWKTGEYLLYNKKTNTYRVFKINKSNLDSSGYNYDSYTHWALVMEEK